MCPQKDHYYVAPFPPLALHNFFSTMKLSVKHKVLFDPAEANHFSPMRIDLYCFPSKLERQPSKCQNFEAQSHSLFSRCLRLATTITGSHPRLATGGWLDLTRQAFHLLDYSPLSGRTIPIYGQKYSE